jgi:hypothetical protein
MHEPLLNIGIPSQLASAGEHYLAGEGSGEKIVMILQVYNNVYCQINIGLLCTLLAQQAGMRLIAVENADEELKPNPGLVSIQNIMQMTQVSAGVCFALNTESTPMEVWGVDDLRRISESYKSMNIVKSLDTVRDRFFSYLTPWLRNVQLQVYPPELANLITGRLIMYGSRLPYENQVGHCRDAAAMLGLDLCDFPRIKRFLEILETKKTVNQYRSKKQMEEFIKRLSRRLNSWYKLYDGNKLDFDLQKAMPIIEYWLEMTNQSAAELEQKFAMGGTESVFLSLKEWVDSYLIESALKEGRTQSAAFEEELMRLALRIDVPYFDLLDLRKTIAIRRDNQIIFNTLVDEISDCCNSLVSRCANSAADEFYRKECQLDLIYKYLGLAAESYEEGSNEIEVGKLGTLLDNIGWSQKCPPSNDILQDLKQLEQGIGAAIDFRRLSAERSRHMIDRTLELLHEKKTDRIILVIGGYHYKAMTRILEDYPHVSWSVIMPKIDMKTINPKHPSYQ